MTSLFRMGVRLRVASVSQVERLRGKIFPFLGSASIRHFIVDLPIGLCKIDPERA
jgi:hypothetical protein